MSATPATIDRELHEARRTVRQFWHFTNLCGCGTPTLLAEQLLWALNAYGEPGTWHDDRPDPDNNPTHMLLAYMLDAWDLTDHGTSLYGAWLTRDGVRLRDALRRIDLNTFLDEDWWDVEHALHPKGRDGSGTLSEGEWETANR